MYKFILTIIQLFWVLNIYAQNQTKLFNGSNNTQMLNSIYCLNGTFITNYSLHNKLNIIANNSGFIFNKNNEKPQLIKLTNQQRQQFIDAHNRWRSQVGVGPIEWDKNLEKFAAQWAVELGKKGCKMKHRPNNEYGENLYWSSGRTFEPTYTVDSWGSEIKDYDGKVCCQNDVVVGHYTQIVWRTTTQVGCAAIKCGTQIIVVCNYNPAGNWVGQHPYE